MHPTPKFSIITVCRNAQSVIEETIQSVITQTYHQIEYIIIDGKSTDTTMDIIRRYHDCISVVVSEPDKGLYDAMNKGLDQATGDYICFLNAGDRFHDNDTLLRITHTLKEGDSLPSVIYGETALVDLNGRFLRMRRLSAPEHLTKDSFRHGMVVCHQAFFARRDLVTHYDLRYRFSADFDWCIRILQKSDNMHNTHLVLVDYLSEGMTTQNRWASLKERFQIMCRHYGILSTLTFHIWFVVRLILKH